MDEIQVIGFDYYGQIDKVPHIGHFYNSFTGLSIPGFAYDIDLTVFSGNKNAELNKWSQRGNRPMKSGVEVFFVTKTGHIDETDTGGDIANHFNIPFERQVGKVYSECQSEANIRIGGASMEHMEIMFCMGDKLLFVIDCYDPDTL